MDSREAYYLASQPEPTPEDSVDIECKACVEQWSSRASCIHSLGDTTSTKYKKFIGVDNCFLGKDLKEFYTCPNGCTDHNNEPVVLHYIHEVDNLTPHDEWKLATLLVKQDKLRTELQEVEDELRNFNY